MVVKAKISYTIYGARKPIVFIHNICQGEDVRDIEALGSPNIVWESLDGTLPTFDYGQSYRFDPNQTIELNSYRFILYDQMIYDAENNLGCRSEIDTVTMTVSPAVRTKIIGADLVCDGTIAEQYYTEYTEGNGYYWTLNGERLNDVKTDTTSVCYVDFTKVGIDTLALYEKSSAECEGFDTLFLNVRNSITPPDNNQQENPIPLSAQTVLQSGTTVAVFPTVVSDKAMVTIVGNENTECHIEVLSADGHVVYSTDATHNVSLVEIPMNGLLQGVYTIRVSDGTSAKTYRVVKQ